MNKDLTMPIWVFVVLFTIAATFPLTIFAVKSWQFHQHQDEQIQMLKRQLEARQHHNFGVPSGLTERPASSHHISTFGAFGCGCLFLLPATYKSPNNRAGSNSTRKELLLENKSLLRKKMANGIAVGL